MQTQGKERLMQVSIEELAAYSSESLSQALPITFHSWICRVLQAVVVLLLAFAMTESFARLLVVKARPEQSHAKEFDEKFGLAQRYATQTDPSILILGDSLVDFALYPELLSARLKDTGLDIKAYNLAVPGNSYEHDLLLLKTAIKKGHKPVLVMVNAHLRLFNQSYYDTQKKNHSLFNRSYLNRCLIEAHPSWETAMRCQIEKNVFLIRYRDFFKTELDTLPVTIFNPKKRMAGLPDVFPKSEFSPEGWTPGYEVYSSRDFGDKFSKPERFKQLSADLADFKWTNRHFSLLADFCKKENLPLMLVWLPEHPENEKAYKYFGLSRSHLSAHLVDSLKRSNVRFVNLRDNLNQSEAFMDPEHVNPEGAIFVTQQIAGILAKDWASLLRGRGKVAMP